jgi:hypothetical protein
MYALFVSARTAHAAGTNSARGDQLFPLQQELHADLEVAVFDRVTESVDLGPYALRVGQCRIDVPLWTPP